MICSAPGTIFEAFERGVQMERQRLREVRAKETSDYFHINSDGQKIYMESYQLGYEAGKRAEKHNPDEDSLTAAYEKGIEVGEVRARVKMRIFLKEQET
jgi:hypothetical protein